MVRTTLWNLDNAAREKDACSTCLPINLEAQFRSLRLLYPRYGWDDGTGIWLRRLINHASGGYDLAVVDASTGAVTYSTVGDVSGAITTTTYDTDNTIASCFSRALALMDTAEASSEFTATGWGYNLPVSISAGALVYSSPSASPYTYALSDIGGSLANSLQLVRYFVRTRFAPSELVCPDTAFFVTVRRVEHTADSLLDVGDDLQIDVPADGSWSDAERVAEPSAQTSDARAELLQPIPWEGVINLWQRSCLIDRVPGFPAFAGASGAIYKSAALAGALSGVLAFTPTGIVADSVTSSLVNTWTDPIYHPDTGDPLYPFPLIVLRQRGEAFESVTSAGGPFPLELQSGYGEMYGWRLAEPAPSVLTATGVAFGQSGDTGYYTIELSEPWGESELSDLVDAYFAGGEPDYLIEQIGSIRNPPGALGSGLVIARKRSGRYAWTETRCYVVWTAITPHLAGRGGSPGGHMEPLQLTVTRYSLSSGAVVAADEYDIDPGDSQTITIGDDEIAHITAAAAEDTYEISYRPPAVGAYAGWIAESDAG